MEIAIAILVGLAAGAAVVGIAVWRRRRADRAKLLSDWLRAFAAVAREAPDRHDRLHEIEAKLATAGTADEDVARFLGRRLEDRLADARVTLTLVSGLERDKIRDAAEGLRDLPPRLRTALVGDLSSDLELLPKAPPTTPKLEKIEVAVRYLELIQDAAVRANNTAGRLFLVRMVLTLIVLAIAIGVAQPEDTIDFLGLGLKLDATTLMVAGSVVASVMQLFDVPYFERGHQLGYRAARLSAELGYATPLDEWDSRDNPHGLQYAAAFRNDPLFGKLLSYNAANVLGQVLAGAFLVGTQLFVSYRLFELVENNVGPSVFVLLPLVTAAIGIRKYQKIKSDHRAGLRPWSGMPALQR